MRIIAGIAKGRKLFTPSNYEIRPALDRVKETIFNILGEVKDLTILDIFAGTGSLGLESLSREAKYAVFIDISVMSIKLLYKNIQHLKFDEKTKVIRKNAISAISILKKDKFDLIFVDPPYKKTYLGEKVLEEIKKYNILQHNGKIIFEHLSKDILSIPAGLKIIRDQKFGQTTISFITME